MRVKRIYYFILFVGIFSCNTRESRKDFSSYYIIADFGNDDKINGIARYYSYDTVLTSLINYNDGIREGLALNYFKNGRIKDSFFYAGGKPNGYWYRFDSSEGLSSSSYYYHGLTVGPQCFYKEDSIIKYYFSDFGKYDLAFAEYTPKEGIVSLDEFKMKPMTVLSKEDGKSKLAFFSYLPQIPRCTTEFTVGVVDSSNNQNPLFSINDNRVFIDTILDIPTVGWNYYISAHIKDPNGRINRVYIEQIEELN